MQLFPKLPPLFFTMKTIARLTLATAISLAALGGVTGCASSYFAKPAATADYGQAPADYEAAIKQHFEYLLKDPESARYRIGTPRKAYGNHAGIQGGGIRWTGYLVKVQVNAKNGFGGYAGYKPYLVLFSGNTIDKVVPGESHVLIHEVE